LNEIKILSCILLISRIKKPFNECIGNSQRPYDKEATVCTSGETLTKKIEGVQNNKRKKIFNMVDFKRFPIKFFFPFDQEAD